MILGYFIFATSSEKKENVDDNIKNESTFNVSSYEEELSQNLENILLKMNSVSKAEVMVVCDKTMTKHYVFNLSSDKTANGEQVNSSEKNELAYEKNGSNSSPILEYCEYPKVVGVMVVVNDVSPSTKLSILNSISIVLNVDQSCISIILD